MSATAATTPAPAPGVDPAAFKAAMRRLAAGVTIITSRHGAAVNGMTATAVCSVSAEPPTVLVVVNRKSASHGVIARGGVFALNFLSQEQSGLAGYFAGGQGKTFEDAPHRIGATGCPLLEGCAAQLECEVETWNDQGTHTIFVGRVLAAVAGEGAPLLYCDAAFRSLGPA